MSRTPIGRLDPAIVGREAGPLTQTVDARWLMAYAAALGEADARLFDTTRGAGPASHPLFAVCYEWPLLVTVRERAIGDAVARFGVHASHRLVIHRPPRAGDELTTTARITAVMTRRSGTLVQVRLETVDRTGRPVTTTDHGSLYRGVATAGNGARDEARTTGESRSRDVVPGAGASGRGPGPGRAATSAWSAPGEVHWSEAVPIPAQLAHVYSECARIWNPIHTDLAIARAAGLPAPILHGTATLALAISRIVARELTGDPGRVNAVSARFTGMVPVPSSVVLRVGERRGDTLAFDAVSPDGAPILSGDVRVSAVQRR